MFKTCGVVPFQSWRFRLYELLCVSWPNDMGTLYTVSRSRPPIVMLNNWPGTKVGLESLPVDVLDDVDHGRDLVKLLHVGEIEVDVAELEEDEELVSDGSIVIDTFQGTEPFCDGHAAGSKDEDAFWLGPGTAVPVAEGEPAHADSAGEIRAELPGGTVAVASTDADGGGGASGGEGVGTGDSDGDEGGSPSPS